MKKLTAIFAIFLLFSGCSLFYTDAYVHINNSYARYMLVEWTETPGLIVNTVIDGMYLGDADTDTWGANCMDYQNVSGLGTVVVAPFENMDIKIVAIDLFSAGDMSLMSTYGKTFVHIFEDVTLEASTVDGGVNISVPGDVLEYK